MVAGSGPLSRASVARASHVWWLALARSHVPLLPACHLQEVVGSAIALSLLTGGLLPLWAGVLVTAVVSFMVLFIERLGVR